MARVRLTSVTTLTPNSRATGALVRKTSSRNQTAPASVPAPNAWTRPSAQTVAAARLENAAAEAGLTELLQSRLEGNLAACQHAVDVLIEHDRRIAERSDIDLEAQTRWVALWELSSRCLSVANLLLDELRLGYTGDPRHDARLAQSGQPPRGRDARGGRSLNATVARRATRWIARRARQGMKARPVVVAALSPVATEAGRQRVIEPLLAGKFDHRQPLGQSRKWRPDAPEHAAVAEDFLGRDEERQAPSVEDRSAQHWTTGVYGRDTP